MVETFADRLYAPGGLVSNGGDVYWTDTVDSLGRAQLRRRAKAGGPIEQIVTDEAIGSISFDTVHVYWWTIGSSLEAWRRAKAGGPIETASNPPEVSPTDSSPFAPGSLFYGTRLGDATHVYFVYPYLDELGFTTIQRYPVGCPAPDTDGDGVLDDKDACPYVDEDHDGNQDTDGCLE